MDINEENIFDINLDDTLVGKWMKISILNLVFERLGEAWGKKIVCLLIDENVIKICCCFADKNKKVGLIKFGLLHFKVY